MARLSLREGLAYSTRSRNCGDYLKASMAYGRQYFRCVIILNKGFATAIGYYADDKQR